jgi:hypothetical protein
MGDSADEKKRRRNARRRQQYAGDPEVREKSKARGRAFKCKNKDAINAERRLRYGTDPEYRASRLAHGSKTQRKSDLKRRYGLSLEGYSAMLCRQNGVCVICLKEDVNKPLSVDHDHKTRMLRDLLCGGCNNGLGNYRDDPALMRRGADYLEYWQWRHADPGNTGPPPFALAATNRFLAPTHQTIQYLELEGEVMTPTDEPTQDNKASRMMRRAILHELLKPFDPDPPPPVDMLQAVSRAIVVKASQGDMTAAREVFDRIDGKTPAAAADADQTSKNATRQVNVSWKNPI